ncbi:hypothetical protein HDU79_000913 [Rhizoclosmatium sp. JEL0117]|nr:hypothetical protein HDU79_000913 [Rhizoclosmatium sp. JEL0117]
MTGSTSNSTTGKASRTDKNWDKIVDDSDGECDIQAPPDLGLPKSKLITILWDPKCEEVRWALTRHGIPYVEHAYPWPLHIWATLEHSDNIPHKQQLHVPIFINYKNEVYKRSTSDIFMYLYAHSFTIPLKIYSDPRALTLQEQFSKTLSQAVTTIYLSTLISSPHLTSQYLFATIHLPSHKALFQTFFPLIRPWLTQFHGINVDGVKKAWDVVYAYFAFVEKELGDKPYLLGKTFTAADISFCAHSALVLFINGQEDGDAVEEAIGFEMPSVKELPKDVQERVWKLRGTKAGRYVIRMYKKERSVKGRKDGYRSFPSKYAKENNPWWVQNNGALLKRYWNTGLVLYVSIWIGMIWFATWKIFAVFIFTLAATLAALYRYYLWGTQSHTKVCQLLFMARGKFEPTERDKVEEAQREKDKANGIIEEDIVATTLKGM